MPNYPLRLTPIRFQDPVASKPLRDNYARLEDAVNDLDTRITNAIKETAPNEIAEARNDGETLSQSLEARFTALGNGLLSSSSIDLRENGELEASGAARAIEKTVLGGARYDRTGTTGETAPARYTLRITPDEHTSKRALRFEVYIAPNAYTAVERVQLLVSSDPAIGANYATFQYEKTLTSYWNDLEFDLRRAPSATVGSVNMDAIQTAQAQIIPAEGEDAIPLGGLIFGRIFFSDQSGLVIPESGMRLKHYEATALINGKYITAPEGVSTAFALPAEGNERIDLIALSESGVVVVEGEERPSPERPTLPNAVALAYAHLRPTARAILEEDDGENAFLIDARKWIFPHNAAKQSIRVDSDRAQTTILDVAPSATAPTIAISRSKEGNPPILQINDAFKVFANGMIKGSAYAPCNYTNIVVGEEYNNGFYFEPPFPETRHALVFIELKATAHENGSFATAKLFVSPDGGETEYLQMSVMVSNYEGTQRSESRAYPIIAPIVNGALWIRYQVSGSGTYTATVPSAFILGAFTI